MLSVVRAAQLWGGDGQCTLRYLHYPPMDAGTLSHLTGGAGGAEPVHWRAGPHTDWDCITLLFQRLGQVRGWRHHAATSSYDDVITPPRHHAVIW